MARRAGWFAVLALSVAPAIGRAGDLEAMQGDWRMTAASGEGQSIPKEAVETVRLRIDGEAVEMKRGGGWVRFMTLKLDPSAKPAAIDLTLNQGPEKGKTAKGIYRLDAKTLRIAFVKPGLDRPKSIPEGVDPAVVVYSLARPEP